jgi:hypothetical protein
MSPVFDLQVAGNHPALEGIPPVSCLYEHLRRPDVWAAVAKCSQLPPRLLADEYQESKGRHSFAENHLERLT